MINFETFPMINSKKFSLDPTELKIAKFLGISVPGNTLITRVF